MKPVEWFVGIVRARLRARLRTRLRARWFGVVVVGLSVVGCP